MKVGDLIRGCFHGGHWFGWILEVKTQKTIKRGETRQVATVWRPELTGTGKEIQTWPLDGQYQIEVMDEGR